MRIGVRLDGLKQSTWGEYGIRFVLGGVITAGAGVIAKDYGPVVGGLFLAFPAIFPASVTLIEIHQRELHNEKRAQQDAAADSAGTSLGSIGLMAFAATVGGLLPSTSSILAISAATASWLLGAGAAWTVWQIFLGWFQARRTSF